MDKAEPETSWDPFHLGHPTSLWDGAQNSCSVWSCHHPSPPATHPLPSCLVLFHLHLPPGPSPWNSCWLPAALRAQFVPFPAAHNWIPQIRALLTLKSSCFPSEHLNGNCCITCACHLSSPPDVLSPSSPYGMRLLSWTDCLEGRLPASWVTCDSSGSSLEAEHGCEAEERQKLQVGDISLLRTLSDTQRKRQSTMVMAWGCRSKTGATCEESEPGRAREKLPRVHLWQREHQIISFEMDQVIKELVQYLGIQGIVWDNDAFALALFTYQCWW